MRTMSGMNELPIRDRMAFSATFLAEHYLPNNRWIKEKKAAVRSRVVGGLRQQRKGRVFSVERLDAICPSDFRVRYMRRGTPVIIANGAATWPLAKWSFDFFRQRYGREMIKLVQRKGVANQDEVVEGKEFSEEIGFADFLDEVQSGGKRYMRFSPLLERFPELLDDFNHEFFKQMSGNNWGVTYQMFVGGTNSYTPLHNAMTSFFFVNVCGAKRWVMIPNHYLAILNPSADGFGYNHSGARVDDMNTDDFPGLDHVDRIEVLMEPGDILFVPSWMWHCVRNDSATIGIRCGFVDPRGMVTESAILSFIRLFAARNPSTLEALYLTLFRKNLPERDKWLLTARLIRR
jgi:hypothetical protein